MTDAAEPYGGESYMTTRTERLLEYRGGFALSVGGPTSCLGPSVETLSDAMAQVGGVEWQQTAESTWVATDDRYTYMVHKVPG